jgi:hypothetical protein
LSNDNHVIVKLNKMNTKPKVLNIAEGKSLLASLPDAPQGLCYVAIGAYCWGKSPNAKKAAENARSNGSAGPYAIHLVNKECDIDSVDGTLYYNSKAEGIKLNIAHFRQQ